MSELGISMCGTKHSHSAGILTSVLKDDRVNFKGVYEPDNSRKEYLKDLDTSPWNQVTWIDSVDDLVFDNQTQAVIVEAGNHESLDFVDKLIRSGKHVFSDKPAGEDYEKFVKIIDIAKKNNLFLQLGYMFRYHNGFSLITDWARSGMLGHIFSIRAHMSTNHRSNLPSAERISKHHVGGVYFDLSGHMIDQIVWILGRPEKITSFLRDDTSILKGFVDNSLSVFEFHSSIAMIDISASETVPTARRFEVYGTNGSAIMEPMEPPGKIRLCLDKKFEEFHSGENFIQVANIPRYDAMMSAFLSDVIGEKSPDRSLDHELLVQETLLRSTGVI